MVSGLSISVTSSSYLSTVNSSSCRLAYAVFIFAEPFQIRIQFGKFLSEMNDRFIGYFFMRPVRRERPALILKEMNNNLLIRVIWMTIHSAKIELSIAVTNAVLLTTSPPVRGKYDVMIVIELHSRSLLPVGSGCVWLLVCGVGWLRGESRSTSCLGDKKRAAASGGRTQTGVVGASKVGLLL